MRSKMLGMCAWAALGALGCGGEPAAQADVAVEDTTDVVDVLDTSGDTDIAEETRDTVPETTLPDTTEVPDTMQVEDTIVTDIAPDTTESEVTPDTTSPDIADTTQVEDTTVADTAPDTTVADTTPDTTVADTYTPLCPATTTTYPVLLSPYAPVCSALSFATDPPTSGPHYPVWATYKTYNIPVNPGFLVHSLKHGAVVITWRCPDGCLDELVELREMLNRRTADRRCDPLLKHRIIVAPRPDQDAKFVASAWGASWKAPCFDPVALEAFIDAHYGQGLEDECFEGVDVEKVRSDSAWYCPP